MHEKETMQDAISQALDSLKPAEPAAETPAAETPAAETPETPEAPASETPEVETPEGKTPETPATETPETPEAKAAAEAKAKETPAPDASKKPDHVNDPIPPELKQQTQERIRSLAGEVKELRPMAETGRMLMDALDDAGMSPQELQYAIGYSKLIHSDNIEDKRKGYGILLNELKALAPMIGEALPGTDPVAAHADLVQAVKEGKLTQAHALEIATNRDRATATTKAQQTNQSRAQEQAQFEQAKTDAIAELNDLGEQLAASDPHYKAKYDAIVPALQVALAKVHPSQWKQVFLNTYRNWKVALPALTPAPAPAPAPAPSPAPLRANKQPAGGGVKTPTTMREAMEAGIKQAGGR